MNFFSTRFQIKERIRFEELTISNNMTWNKQKHCGSDSFFNLQKEIFGWTLQPVKILKNNRIIKGKTKEVEKSGKL
jgi:hypothetical protein